MMMSLALVAGVPACDTADATSGPQAVFAPSELASWKEMRDCRHSHEHELRFIRVFADAGAEAPYGRLNEDTPYPVGARLVKLEHDDDKCANVVGATAMKKLPPSTSPESNDWLWQKLDADYDVLEEGPLARCITCHEEHCPPPFFGYDLTCAEEL